MNCQKCKVQFPGSVLNGRNMQFFPSFSFLLPRMWAGWFDHEQQPWTTERKPHVQEVEQPEKTLHQFWAPYRQTPFAWERNKLLSCLSLCCFGYSLLSFFLFYKFIYFIYFWLCWVFVAARRLPLVAASVAVRGLLIAVVSLVAEHVLQACGLQ